MAKKKTLRQVKKRKSTITKGVARNIPKPKALPAEIRACIRGRTINLSGASEFYKKTWEATLPQFASDIRNLEGDRYRFSESFLGELKGHIRGILQEFPIPQEPPGPNLIVVGLRRATYQREQMENPNVKSFDEYAMLHPDWVAASQEGLALAADLLPDSTLLNEKDGKLDFPRNTALTNPIEIRCEYGNYGNRLPELTITLRGAPVGRLMKAASGANALSEMELKRAKSLWRRVSTQILALLRLGKASPGKPPLMVGRRAAYLHYHMGLSWPRVAEILCDGKNHHKGQKGHNLKCTDGLRLNARNYFKLIENNPQNH